MTVPEKMNAACKKAVKKQIKKERMRTRNIVLLATGIFLVAFISYTLVVYTVNKWQWDALFPYVLGIGGVVDVMTALIAIKKDKEEE